MSFPKGSPRLLAGLLEDRSLCWTPYAWLRAADGGEDCPQRCKSPPPVHLAPLPAYPVSHVT